jgi:hypothetical protein
VRKSPFRPARLVPAAANDPFAGLVLRDCDSHALLEFSEGIRALQVQSEFVASRPAKMRVRVVKTRHQEAAF